MSAASPHPVISLPRIVTVLLKITLASASSLLLARSLKVTKMPSAPLPSMTLSRTSVSIMQDRSPSMECRLRRKPTRNTGSAPMAIMVLSLTSTSLIKELVLPSVVKYSLTATAPGELAVVLSIESEEDRETFEHVSGNDQIVHDVVIAHSVPIIEGQGGGEHGRR